MNKLTAKQILEIVENQLKISAEDFGYGDMVNPLEHIGTWKEVFQRGGESEGSVWYSVKHFPDHDVYIQTNGFYSSYNGTDFENGYGKEVKPVQVEVTQYKSI